MNDWKAFADRVTDELHESGTVTRRYLIDGLGILLASRRDLLIYENQLSQLADQVPTVAPRVDWNRLISTLRTSGLEAACDADLVAIALCPKHLNMLFTAIEQEIMTSETRRSPWQKIYQDQYARMMAD